MSDFGEGSEAYCRPCRMVPPEFERAVAHGLYTDTLRTLLHLLKYDGLQPVADSLGALLARQVAAVDGLPARMVVVPVPLFGSKRRERGFNQAELLARAVCAAMRRLRPEWKGELAAGALMRQRATESQAGLTPHQRRRNVRGVFSVPKPERVCGLNVLLIDDICTTGATARACSAALMKAGAARVWVATAARAQRQEIQFVPTLSTAAETPMHEDVAMWDGAMWDGGKTRQ